MSCVAIIAAAGLGLRLKSNIPKPYLLLDDIPILAHTLEAFEDCLDVTSVYLVVAEDKIDYCQRHIVDKYQLDKVAKIITGGKRRQASVCNGLQKIAADTDIVVVHDGARPLLRPQLISSCIREAQSCGAAIAALPINDTIKQVTNENQIEKTIARNGLWVAQTPQAFSYLLLKKAFDEAYRSGFEGTDEAGLVERIGHGIKIVMGSAYNIKVTTPDDLVLAEAVLNIMKQQ